MFTLFACPKPFRGHIDIIQRNAIHSWTLLRPKPEIILLGNDAGVADVARHYDVVHVGGVATNEQGTPFVNSVFKVAQETAHYPIVCYVNSDILLMSDFVQALKVISHRLSAFLMLGQRWDLDIMEPWSFASDHWQLELKALLRRKGLLHPPNGIDFFCFTRGMYADIPPFTIGRLAWDNWLVWRAWSSGIPVVDVTEAVDVIHQNHDYAPNTIRYTSAVESPTPGSASKITRWLWSDLGPEARQNIALVPGSQNLNIWAATWRVDRRGRLRRRRLTLKPSYWYYQLKQVLPISHPAFGRVMRGILALKTAVFRRGASTC